MASTSTSTRTYSPKPKAAPQPAPTSEPTEHIHRHIHSRASSPPTPKRVRFAKGAGKAAQPVSNVTVGASDAQGIIITSALVTFALGFLNSYLVPRKTPRIRLFIGIGILYIALSVVAQFNPKIARAFAILVMVTALLAEGGGVLNWLMGRGTHDHLGISSTGTPNLPPVKPPQRQLAPPQPLTPLPRAFPNLNTGGR